LKLRDFSQELFELGPRGAAFRILWEARGRVGLMRTFRHDVRGADTSRGDASRDINWTRHLAFADAPSVAKLLRRSIAPNELVELKQHADRALIGRIRAFGRFDLDYRSPIDWHRHPVTGLRWDPARNLTFEIGENAPQGDVKYSWEICRFPHAYYIARAAAFFPENADRWAAGLLAQFEDFVGSNPCGLGVQWTSGQEVAYRLLSWLFAYDTLLAGSAVAARAEAVIENALLTGGEWIEQHLAFSRIAVYNNHLLSEAVAMLAIGSLLPTSPNGPRWRALGYRILDEESERQFYEDGAYIQQSHNYHRVAIQNLLWASMVARAAGDRPSVNWTSALERSLDFLYAHQNPVDGRLPNYGSNDGSLPSPLTACDFSDFRPILQTVSLLVRGERLYAAGPWDEEAAWWLGTSALDAPIARSTRRTISFAPTGYHVLRGGRDEASFAAFRCGSLRDRFSQIDMLHVDVWWKGQNVLTDAGSFQYNGAKEWHNHFMSTKSHNTVVVDDRDQMVHFRQFKVLYWTEADLLEFSDTPDTALCVGRHRGYERYPGNCNHLRSVLFVKDDVWVVADCISGQGDHTATVQWLCGDFEAMYDESTTTLTLATPKGPFDVSLYDSLGRGLRGDVVRGGVDPPRGWLSRYYGEKIPAPSLAVTQTGPVPLCFVSILAGVPPQVEVDNGAWIIATPQSRIRFKLDEGQISDVVSERISGPN
jgi:hypothetical protein